MVFVTGQILLAVTLLYGAGLLITTEGRPGSEIELPQGAAPVNELVVLEVEAAHLSVAQRRERYHELMEQVQGIPTIVSAGLASQGSLGGRGTLDWVLIPVAGQLVGAQAEHHAVSPEWFDTLGVSVDGNTPGNGTVALNATMGRFVGLGGSGWETRAPQPMRLGGARGVDVQAAGLLMEDLPIASPGWDRLYRAYPFGQITSRAPPVVYLSFDEYPPERAELLIRILGEDNTGSPQRFGYQSASEDQSWSELEMALLAAARRADLRASPPTRLAARLHGLGAAGRWFSTMAGILGGFAVAVAVLGVLGASRARARQRIAELGVRRALGGSRGRVVAGVIGKLGLPLSVAGWIGLGTAVAAGEALTAFLPQAPASDASLYLASVLVLAVGAVLGAMVPTLQATSIPPAQARRLGAEIDGGDLA